MHSKTNKLREQLASAAQEREMIEKQKKDLEAQMNKGKTNMDKINKGLKGHEISGALAELDLDDNARQTKPKLSRNPSIKTDGSHMNLVKVSSVYTIKSTPSTSSIPVATDLGTIPRSASMKQAVIMPAFTRITDWCYTGALQSSPPTVKSNDVYEFVRWLGRGSFGDVQLVKSVEEKHLFAMKTIFSEHENETKKSLREVEFLRNYRHPYIIDIFDSFLTQQPKMLYIVMHYCEGGDLGKLITAAHKNSTSINEYQILKWTIQLALALHFLHENQILHRDLKPSNALLTDGGETVKLADFGLTIQLQNNVCERATEAGTPLYAAPEMINGEKYSYPIDCWSFGVMLHELMRLSPPFQRADTTELVKSILNDDPPELPSNYSNELKLISNLFLSKNPNHRLGFAGMLSDPFISSKVHTCASSYRPRSLEERIRRAHVKQLQMQIDLLNSSQLSSSIEIPELVRLNEIERAEKAAAQAQAAALLEAQSSTAESDTESDFDGSSPNKPRGNSLQLSRKPSIRKQSFGDTKASSLLNSKSSDASNMEDSSMKATINLEAMNDQLSLPKFDIITHAFVEETFDDIESFDKSPVREQFNSKEGFEVAKSDESSQRLESSIDDDMKEGKEETTIDATKEEEKVYVAIEGDTNYMNVECPETRVVGGRIGQAIAEAQEIDKQLTESEI